MNKVAVVGYFATVALLLAFFSVLPAARADQGNQATKVTFSQPVRIPGRVLPAGTYWFILPQNANEREQVRIYNSDQTIFYGTVLTVEAERLQPTDKPAFTFTQRNSDQPEAIVTWFYPGGTTAMSSYTPNRSRRNLRRTSRSPWRPETNLESR